MVVVGLGKTHNSVWYNSGTSLMDEITVKWMKQFPCVSKNQYTACVLGFIYTRKLLQRKRIPVKQI